MQHPANLIIGRGGVSRGSSLEPFGVSRRALSRAVDEGSVLRIRAGVFAVPSAPPDVIRAAEHGGALTCSRALRLHGVWTLDDDDEGPHVWLGSAGRTHHKPECACVSHFFTGRTPLGVVTLENALVHVQHCQGDEAFFVAYESALSKRKLTRAARAGIRSRLPRSARWLLDLARVDADSGLESLLRLRLHVLGIRLDCQVTIDTVGRVDFVIAGRLILETDGRAHHDGETNRHRDLLRDARASRLGYETLRFDYALIVHDWPTVQAAILGALVRLRERA